MRLHLSLALLLFTALFSGGCASTPKQVAFSEMRTSMGLDPRDVADVAGQMAESILASNVLRIRGADGRAIIAFSTFRNNTSLEQFDPNMLFNRVSVILNRTGTAYVHGSHDPLVGRHQEQLAAANRQIEAENELLEFTGSKRRIPKYRSQDAPQYSLGIELIESSSQVGKTVQAAYQVHMTVVEVSRGVVAWEDLRDVAKRYR